MQISSRVRNKPGGSCDHVAPQLPAEPAANRVAGGITPPAPTPPGVRVRTGRFLHAGQTTEPLPQSA